MEKVAIITGGSSGIGLAIATALASRQDWIIYIIGLNVERGEKAATMLGSKKVTFCRADVTDHTELGGVFEMAFRRRSRLDFVFANAGIIETKDFYAYPDYVDASSTASLPPLDFGSIETNLKGVIQTCHLAQLYFRQCVRSDAEPRASLVITASCGGLYPSYYSPLYTAAKHGLVGFGRSIAASFLADGVRVNTICPGIVKTNLVSDWSGFPEHLFTPMGSVLRVVLHLVDGDKDFKDSQGASVTSARLSGLTVEISQESVFIRKEPEFLHGAMRDVMKATQPEYQRGRILKAAARQITKNRALGKPQPSPSTSALYRYVAFDHDFIPSASHEERQSPVSQTKWTCNYYEASPTRTPTERITRSRGEPRFGYVESTDSSATYTQFSSSCDGEQSAALCQEDASKSLFPSICRESRYRGRKSSSLSVGFEFVNDLRDE